ncbi:hypothetical protein TNCV_4109401 [Trichonephila clavipes]|nr:hypothetical protein TNCV_4109401 [Trichonephila clavipes]
MFPVNWTMGVKGSTSWMKRLELHCSRRVRPLIKPVLKIHRIMSSNPSANEEPPCREADAHYIYRGSKSFSGVTWKYGERGAVSLDHDSNLQGPSPIAFSWI